MLRRFLILVCCLLLTGLGMDWTFQSRHATASAILQDTPQSATPGLFIMPTLPPSPTPMCSAAPPNRLILHQRGRVTEDDPSPLNLREGPGTNYAILATLDSGSIFWVISGPRCSEY